MKKHINSLFAFLGALGVLGALGGKTSAQQPPTYEKRWLSGMFFSEGATFGDFNHDGKSDVVSGPTIWDGPDFTIKHVYT